MPAATKAINYTLRSAGNTILKQFVGSSDANTQTNADAIALGNGFTDSTLIGQAVSFAELINPIVLNPDGVTIRRVNNTTLWTDTPVLPTLHSVSLGSPAAATNATVVAATALTSAVQTLTTGITQPKGTTISVKGNAAGIAGNVTIIGSYKGVAQTEAIALSGTGVVESTYVYDAITSYTLPIETHAGTDTVSIGNGIKLGIGAILPRNQVIRTFVANAIDASATVVTNATLIGKNYVTPAVALDGTKAVDIDYYA